MSVQIVDFKERKNAEDEIFFALILEGDLEIVKSQESGRHYATARRASMSSTFTEQRCQQLIGKTMPGTIQKVECPEYEYTLPETGEIITLTHRYEYVPEESMEDEVFERKNGAEKPVPA
jgi:hypothetical protein